MWINIGDMFETVNMSHYLTKSFLQYLQIFDHQTYNRMGMILKLCIYIVL